jgi:hypothetical protein
VEEIIYSWALYEQVGLVHPDLNELHFTQRMRLKPATDPDWKQRSMNGKALTI